MIDLRQKDLIDTQWNVNDSGQDYKVVSSNRFNRYIVECKLVQAFVQMIQEIAI